MHKMALEEGTSRQKPIFDVVLHTSGHSENIILILPCFDVSRRMSGNKKPFPMSRSRALVIIHNLK